MKKLLVVIAFFSLWACQSNKPDENALSAPNGTISLEKPRIEYVTFKSDNGWGYDIFINQKRYIHQPSIPAVTGVQGFASEDKAKKTAEFVIEKIKKDIMPPAVTPEELDSIGVLTQ